MNSSPIKPSTYYGSFAKIGALRLEIAAYLRGERRKETLLQKVASFRKDKILAEAEVVRPLLEQVEKTCAPVDKCLEKQELDAMIDSCDQLRFRMLSDALIACPNQLLSTFTDFSKLELGTTVTP